MQLTGRRRCCGRSGFLMLLFAALVSMVLTLQKQLLDDCTTNNITVDNGTPRAHTSNDKLEAYREILQYITGTTGRGYIPQRHELPLPEV